MRTATVNKIIPFSSVDGPGNRTAIFLQECNFCCTYCHNPETIAKCIHCGDCIGVCPVGALTWGDDSKVLWNSELCCGCDACIKICSHSASPKVQEMTADELTALIAKNIPFIGGVTVSGGEATLYHEFLGEFFPKIKALGLTAFVDSNGSLPFAEMSSMLESMDQAMLDLKAYDEAEHIMLTGKSVQPVLENIKFLAEQDKLFEIRTVIVPEMLNNEYTVDMASKLIAPYPKVRYKLIAFRNLGVRGELENLYSPTDGEMERLKAIAMQNGVLDVVIV